MMVVVNTVMIVIAILLELLTFTIMFRKRNKHRLSDDKIDRFLAGQGATNDAVLEHLQTKDSATKALIMSVVKECLRQMRDLSKQVNENVNTGIADAANKAADAVTKAAEIASGSTSDSVKLKVVPPNPPQV